MKVCAEGPGRSFCSLDVEEDRLDVPEVWVLRPEEFKAFKERYASSKLDLNSEVAKNN